MNFLFEIGCEELPASYIHPALSSLKESFAGLLAENRIGFKGIETFGTPRRLTLFVDDISEKQEDSDELIPGPPKKNAYDEAGNPTKGLLGFCAKLGVTPDECIEIEEKKKKATIVRMAVRIMNKGKKTAEILPELILAALKKLVFPKNMRWNHKNSDDSNFTFARPVRYFLSLLDKKIIKFESAGIEIGKITMPHKFIKSTNKKIRIENADFTEYSNKLREGFVILAEDERKKLIQKQIAEITQKHKFHISEADVTQLLPEVVNLVEYPTVLIGEFEKDYLEMPAEILKSAMIKHQRYFPLEDSKGQLINKFLIVANRAEDVDNVIKKGNERVIKARLADALFFFNNDIKVKLADKVNKLDSYAFHQELGSMVEKVERLKKLIISASKILKIKSENAVRAAQLCKSDLLSEVVFEFTELQGIMGGHYARISGESEEVAQAISEQYLPAGKDDKIPESITGKVLALTEKIDSLAGYFLLEIDKKKGGDPLGLRRLTLGMIRIAKTLENFDLKTIFEISLGYYEKLSKKKADVIVTDEMRINALQRFENYLKDRLNVILREEEYSYDAINAVVASSFLELTGKAVTPDKSYKIDIADIYARLNAVAELSKQKSWVDFVKLVERTANITKKNNADVITFQQELLVEPAEKTLGQNFANHHAEIEKMFRAKKYLQAGEKVFTTFNKITHEFFEAVFVNVDDEKLRDNRLGLIRSIYLLFAENFACLENIVLDNF